MRLKCRLLFGWRARPDADLLLLSSAIGECINIEERKRTGFLFNPGAVATAEWSALDGSIDDDYHTNLCCAPHGLRICPRCTKSKTGPDVAERGNESVAEASVHFLEAHLGCMPSF